jgi:hypothetical protein
MRTLPVMKPRTHTRPLPTPKLGPGLLLVASKRWSRAPFVEWGQIEVVPTGRDFWCGTREFGGRRYNVFGRLHPTEATIHFAQLDQPGR